MEKRAVQVQMMESTLEKIEGLTKTLHTNSRSDVVKTSIDITKIVAEALSQGGSVTVEKNGEKVKIVIPGI